MRRRAPAGSWLAFAETYGVATEVLGRRLPLGERVSLWQALPLGQALTLIGSMLKDLDLGDSSARAVEAGWIGVIPDGEVKSRLLRAFDEGLRFLAPQLLLLAALEAIEHCPPGDPAADLIGAEAIFQLLLGIAEEAGSPRVGGDEWGGLDSGLAAELIANQYFGHSVSPIDQMAWTNDNWRSPWPRPTVTQKLVHTAGGEPAELFREATGTEIDEFAAVGVHLWVQAQQHGYVRFPSEFFNRLGLDRAAVDRFLEETSTDLASLRSDVRDERSRTGSSRWAFHALRRRPIVRLDNGEWLVLRVGFVLQRALGDVTYWDVRTYLRAQDKATGGKREEAFRSCLGSALEGNVERTLKRIFPGLVGSPRVFTEIAMQKAWGGKKKGQVPSVCDFAIDCGDVWLLFDVTDRRIPEALINGSANAAALDAELDIVLTRKKASQFASTIRLLTTDMGKLAKREPLANTLFVCLVITPVGGLGWNPAVDTRAKERLKEFGTLQSSRVLPVATLSVRDLTILECAVEHGHSASNLLADWRANGVGHSFEQVLQLRGIPLGFSEWIRASAMRLIDELVATLERHEESESD